MGARGPKPKPTKMRLLDGNPSKRPLTKNEPQPTTGVPTMPQYLTKEAKLEWGRVVPELDRMGLMTKVDRAAIAMYCQAWARYLAAEEELSKYGSVLKLKDSDYIQVSPYATISRHNAQLVSKLCAEFGFTPSSRGRMNLGNDADPEFPDWLD